MPFLRDRIGLDTQCEIISKLHCRLCTSVLHPQCTNSKRLCCSHTHTYHVKCAAALHDIPNTFYTVLLQPHLSAALHDLPNTSHTVLLQPHRPWKMCSGSASPPKHIPYRSAAAATPTMENVQQPPITYQTHSIPF